MQLCWRGFESRLGHKVVGKIINPYCAIRIKCADWNCSSTKINLVKHISWIWWSACLHCSWEETDQNHFCFRTSRMTFKVKKNRLRIRWAVKRPSPTPPSRPCWSGGWSGSWRSRRGSSRWTGSAKILASTNNFFPFSLLWWCPRDSVRHVSMQWLEL